MELTEIPNFDSEELKSTNFIDSTKGKPRSIILLFQIMQFIVTCAFKLLELNENLRCIILGTFCLNTRNRVRIDTLLIRPVKVEWLPVTRELYRSWLLTFCNHYKDHRWIGIQVSWWKSVCVDKILLRSQCVVVLIKQLKVLATCRKYGTRQA